MSLEAIFLSTFVMISQNRADEKRQVNLTGRCLRTRRWRVDGVLEGATRLAGLLRSSLRTSASPLGSGSLQRLRDRRAITATSSQAHRRHLEAMDVLLGSLGVAASTRPQVPQGPGTLSTEPLDSRRIKREAAL